MFPLIPIQSRTSSSWRKWPPSDFHHGLLRRASRNQTGQQTWRERPRLPQTDSSVCSAPGRGIRLRQPSALPADNASTNRGAANLEVHATSQLGPLSLPPQLSNTIRS